MKKFWIILSILLCLISVEKAFAGEDHSSAYNPDPNSIYQVPADTLSFSEIEANVWLMDYFASAAFANKKGDLYELHLSFEENKPGQIRMAFQPFIGITNGTNSEAFVTGIDALFKFPIIANRKFFMDIEVGGGLQQTGPKSFPATGSHFNWRPQGGLGFRYVNNNGGSTIFGVRYQHISNGGISIPNPGVDNLFLYLGYQLRF